MIKMFSKHKSFCISFKGNCNITVTFAISELRKYLYKISGSTPRPKHSNVYKFHLSLSENESDKDQYTIQVNEDGTFINALNSRALLFGVYTFLEHLGCRWVWPGENQEIIPRMETVSSKKLSIECKPTLSLRGLALYELNSQTVKQAKDIVDWMAKNRFNLIMSSEDRKDPVKTQCMHWPEVRKELLPEIQKRNLILELSEHATHLFLSPDLFKKNPDWFAEVNGERVNAQMCFSNKEAIKQFSYNLIKHINIRKEAKIFGTWPLDGAGGYCTCTECEKKQAPFNAISTIAKEVERVRPDVTIEYLAYQQQTLPLPDNSSTVPKNLSVLFCKNPGSLSTKWISKTKNSKGTLLFEYSLGDFYRWAGNVWLQPDYAIKTGHRLSKDYFRGFISLFLPIKTWWRTCFNLYFLRQGVWSDGKSMRKTLSDICRAYFGPIHLQAKNIFYLIFEKLQDKRLMNIYGWSGGNPSNNISKKLCQSTHVQYNLLSKKIKEALQLLNDNSMCDNKTKKLIQRRLNAISNYTGYFLKYQEERSVKNNRNPSNLINYAVKNPCKKDGVNIYPRFISWRFDKIIRWDITNAGF
jgi:hypothetical protein